MNADDFMKFCIETKFVLFDSIKSLNAQVLEGNKEDNFTLTRTEALSLFRIYREVGSIIRQYANQNEDWEAYRK